MISVRVRVVRVAAGAGTSATRKLKTKNNKHHLFPGSDVPERCGRAGVSLARRMEGKSECVLTNHSLLLPREGVCEGGGGEGGLVREHREECRDWITGDES